MSTQQTDSLPIVEQAKSRLVQLSTLLTEEDKLQTKNFAALAVEVEEGHVEHLHPSAMVPETARIVRDTLNQITGLRATTGG